MPDIFAAMPGDSKMACERCVWGTGDHADFCRWYQFTVMGIAVESDGTLPEGTVVMVNHKTGESVTMVNVGDSV